jgi:fructan beta-fructosidase
VFFDQSIITVFANDGEVVFTTQIFPHAEDNSIELFSTKGKAIMKMGKFWMMKSTW